MISNLGKYIVRGVAITVFSVCVSEVVFTIPTVVNKYKEAKKVAKEKNDKVDILPIIAEAAKEKVESIKENPRAEIMSIYGCFALLWGNWMGYWNGVKRGWNISENITDNLVTTFKSHAPKEFNGMLNVLQKQNVNVLLAEWTHGDNYYRETWNANKCKPAKIIDTIAKEV